METFSFALNGTVVYLQGELLMKVLSLFDGISGGREVLRICNIKPEKYVAFEIDEKAIKVAKRNFPDIEEKGDVLNANWEDFKDFDVLIGGSPCNDFSSLNREKKGLEGLKSRLFYQYLDALKTIKPKYFFLENVQSMGKENRDKLTALLTSVRDDVKLYKIDSADYGSFCHRKRYYWTNIPLTDIPKSTRLPSNELLLDGARDISEWFYRSKSIGWAYRKPVELPLTKPTATITSADDFDFKYNGKIYRPGNKYITEAFGYRDSYFLPEERIHQFVGLGWHLPTIKRFFENLI